MKESSGNHMVYDIVKISSARKVTLCGTNVYPNPEFHPDRIMPEHDLLYIYQGEQKVAQDDEVFTLQSGDLMFLRAGSHHYGPERCSVNARTMFIHMNRLPEDHTASLSGLEFRSHTVGNTLCLPTVIHCGQDENILHMFKGIIDAFWSHRADAERMMMLQLNMLLNELCHIAMTEEQISDEWSMDVIRLFHEHPEQNYSLQELADREGMSIKTMSTRFRQITGTSIHQYQLNIKLEAAYRSLRNGSDSVKSVALKFGFCDPYYFSRAFKRKFGITPSAIIHSKPGENPNRSPIK